MKLRASSISKITFMFLSFAIFHLSLTTPPTNQLIMSFQLFSVKLIRFCQQQPIRVLLSNLKLFSSLLPSAVPPPPHSSLVHHIQCQVKLIDTLLITSSSSALSPPPVSRLHTGVSLVYYVFITPLKYSLCV